MENSARTSEELKETYSTLSTIELLGIVDNKFGYTALAISSALEELSIRKVSEQDIENYKNHVVENDVQFLKQNIVYDLNFFQKNLFYFLWIPLLNFPFKLNFREDNFLLKLKQANYYSLLGFLFLMLSGFISAILDWSDWTSLAIWVLGFPIAFTFDEKFNRQRIIKRLEMIYGDPVDTNNPEATKD
ncbi:MAG: hypothetical protein ABI378_06840 [Chitinophagaceae bacterium]